MSVREIEKGEGETIYCLMIVLAMPYGHNMNKLSNSLVEGLIQYSSIFFKPS